MPVWKSTRIGVWGIEKNICNSPGTLPLREMSSVIYSSLSRIVIRVLHSPGSWLLGCNLSVSIKMPINSNTQYSTIQIPRDIHIYTKNHKLVNIQMCLRVSLRKFVMFNSAILMSIKTKQKPRIKCKYGIISPCWYTRGGKRYRETSADAQWLKYKSTNLCEYMIVSITWSMCISPAFLYKMLQSQYKIVP